MFFNPEEYRRLTFLETEEGDGTEAKRSKSFSRALLVLLFAIEQATGASKRKDRIKYRTAMKTHPLLRQEADTGRPQVSAQGAWIGFSRGPGPHSHKCSGVGYSPQRAAETQS